MLIIYVSHHRFAIFANLFNEHFPKCLLGSFLIFDKNNVHILFSQRVDQGKVVNVQSFTSTASSEAALYSNLQSTCNPEEYESVSEQIWKYIPVSEYRECVFWN